MTSDPRTHNLPSPLELAEAVSQIAGQTQAQLTEFIGAQGSGDLNNTDPLGVLPAFAAYSEALMRDPTALMTAQFEAWQTYLEVWQNSASRLMGLPVEPLRRPSAGDRRFKAEDWDNNQIGRAHV